MKKRYVLLLTVALLAVGLLATTQAYAQDTTPAAPGEPGFGPGRFHPEGRGPGDGLLHEYMTDAIADVFGVSPEKVEELRSKGDTLWQALDLDFEDFRSRMLDARQAALENAASDGVISQDQVEWMLDRMQNPGKGPYGPGDGSCLNAGSPQFQRGGRGGRGMGGW